MQSDISRFLRSERYRHPSAILTRCIDLWCRSLGTKIHSGFPLQTVVLPVESLPAKLVELDLPGEVPPDRLEDVLGHGELEGVSVPLLPDLRVAVVELERT